VHFPSFPWHVVEEEKPKRKHKVEEMRAGPRGKHNGDGRREKTIPNVIPSFLIELLQISQAPMRLSGSITAPFNELYKRDQNLVPNLQKITTIKRNK
jgi:hypothetical protein